MDLVRICWSFRLQQTDIPPQVKLARNKTIFNQIVTILLLLFTKLDCYFSLVFPTRTAAVLTIFPSGFGGGGPGAGLWGCAPSRRAGAATPSQSRLRVGLPGPRRPTRRPAGRLENFGVGFWTGKAPALSRRAGCSSLGPAAIELARRKSLYSWARARDAKPGRLGRSSSVVTAGTRTAAVRAADGPGLKDGTRTAAAGPAAFNFVECE